jgi:hypothetical protein
MIVLSDKILQYIEARIAAALILLRHAAVCVSAIKVDPMLALRYE